MLLQLQNLLNGAKQTLQGLHIHISHMGDTEGLFLKSAIAVGDLIAILSKLEKEL